ncbi:hypothetical protein LWI28_013935 [Acer negundo]|uniref:Uncharacterized protein n=1 Tax=Acer negundo TaxID=4023 RepID=A0AAD5NWS5_ACENE|nr:hypothetical protein LWI28_013935 [Acer negundo]
MKVCESVNEYFAPILAMVNKLRVNKGTMDDVAVIERILRSMKPKFDYVDKNDIEPDAGARSGDKTKTDEHSNTEESQTNGGSNGSNEGNSLGEDHSLEAREQRSRRQPTWIRDYMGGEGLSEEEDMGLAGSPVLHVSRKVNCVTHSLSKMALDIDEDRYWLEENPPCVDM